MSIPTDEGQETVSHPRKAVVINAFWAGIFATIISASFAGGFAYLWNTNAAFAMVQRDVAEMKRAELPVRQARMEEQLVFVSKQLGRMDDKIDRLLEARQK